MIKSGVFKTIIFIFSDNYESHTWVNGLAFKKSLSSYSNQFYSIIK